MVFLAMLSMSGLHAVKLCKVRWGPYTGGWPQSSSSGWNHTHNWWGDVVTVPVGGMYLVTTETYAGDNDGSWYHYRSKSDGVFIPTGYQVAIYGTVKQAYNNNCGNFYVRGTLHLRRPNGTSILSSQRTFVEGGPVDTGCNIYSGVCCGSSASEDIDRARSRIRVTALTPSAASTHGILWSEATVRALM
jgi:hypothetical protein